MRALAPGVFYTFNIEWMDLSYMDYIERFITLAGDHGILVMLDLHAMEAGAWKDSGGVGTHGGELLYEAWAGLSTMFCDPVKYWNVFAADLKNEPHGMYWGPLGTAHTTEGPRLTDQPSPPPAPSPGPACLDNPGFRDKDGDACHAYELSPTFCGFPGYEDTCTECCASCRGTPDCAAFVAPTVCTDDPSFRNHEGHGCDIYRNPMNNAQQCGAVGHEGTCQSCCFSCNGETTAPLCFDGGAQVPTTPPQPVIVQDPDYPYEERWDRLATDLGNKVHRECPRWLIVVEGVGHCMKQTTSGCTHPSAPGQDTSVPTWWGENLQGVEEFPVNLNYPHKVVYSPHSYGPSVYPQPYFEDPTFPNNMPEIWDLQWGKLTKTGRAPILLGEWGGRYTQKDKQWQQKMAAYLKDEANQVAGSFYWCLNPESGDTGGLLETWSNFKADEGKIALLAGMPATVVPTTSERSRPPPPTPPKPPPLPNPPSPSPPPPSPHPPVLLPHLAAHHPPSSASPSIHHRRHHPPPSSAAAVTGGGGEAGGSADASGASAPGDGQAAQPVLGTTQLAKLVAVALLLLVLCAMARRCRASISRQNQQLVSREEAHVKVLDVVSSGNGSPPHRDGRRAVRVTKITKQSRRPVEHSMKLVEEAGLGEDELEEERKADEEESHVL